jgi:hypothetical protein
MANMTGSKLSIFSHPGKITGYWISTRSFPQYGNSESPISARDGVEGQYVSRDDNQANMEMPMY